MSRRGEILGSQFNGCLKPIGCSVVGDEVREGTMRHAGDRRAKQAVMR